MNKITLIPDFSDFYIEGVRYSLVSQNFYEQCGELNIREGIANDDLLYEVAGKMQHNNKTFYLVKFFDDNNDELFIEKVFSIESKMFRRLQTYYDKLQIKYDEKDEEIIVVKEAIHNFAMKIVRLKIANQLNQEVIINQKQRLTAITFQNISKARIGKTDTFNNNQKEQIYKKIFYIFVNDLNLVLKEINKNN